MDGDAYLESQVMTASPHRLHQLVVDAALRHAGRAAVALEAQAWESLHENLSQARDFVNELIIGLDADSAPELVERMAALFTYVHRNLVRADFERNATLIADSIRVLEKHRETWIELGRQLAAQGIATAPAAGTMQRLAQSEADEISTHRLDWAM